MKIDKDTKFFYAEDYGSGVYLIRNVSNEKVYIGSARNFEYRLRQHFVDLKSGRHQLEELQRDFNNGDTFEIKVVCKCPIAKYTYIKRILETFYILRYKAVDQGYNRSYNKGTKERAEMYVKENAWVILQYAPLNLP